MYLVYYCWIKSSGSSVERHKCIERLLYLRVIMERTKPIEKKLTYQINKLLSETVADEALEAKPDMGDLVVDKNSDGVYRPPKIAGRAMEPTEDETTNRTRAHEEMEEEVNEEIDAPEEIGFNGEVLHGTEEDADERAIREYEEMHHVRLQSTKKKAKKQNQLQDDFKELEDFINGLDAELAKENKSKRLIGDVVDDNDEIDSDEIVGHEEGEDDDEEIDSDDI